jgi:hypothetical protein
MQKGIYERTNKGLGFKLTNFMSFGESLISARFIQKTVKGDLFVKRNQGIILWHLRGKILEDSRRFSTEEGGQPPPCVCHLAPYGPHAPASSRIFLHRLLGLHLCRPSSWFDSSAHVAPPRLYKQTPAPLPET